MNDLRLKSGSRFPMGATPDDEGVNFCIFSRHATRVELLLYESHDSPDAFAVIPLDPETNRTFYFWHVYVCGAGPGTCYTWRVHGPDNTRESGFRFDPRRELLDPWARIVTDTLWDRAAAMEHDTADVPGMRAMVPPADQYDWEGDTPLARSAGNAVIYEMHVGGFTRHPSSGVRHPGTFVGVIEKIPYLKDLGITDVELMPVMAFDQQDVPPGARERGLHNFWGYSPHSFFAPHPGYSVSPERGTVIDEFRDMVKAFHRAGIGVIMDVVFNHTAEGGEDGPVINFKGLGNRAFYHLDPNDRRKYLDFTGCGNTINCNHPLVAAFIVECLEYWVEKLHVDGFRFDLASVMARGEDTRPMYHAPVVWSIEFSAQLAATRLIAEAWDAGGLYQVGGFPGFRWQEWNGLYRDVMRRFVRGDHGVVNEVATRIAGSSDLYQPSGRFPFTSINFITCHDGFTMYDLVSYNRKHNEANGENNRDGSDENYSWNCGVEGDTDDPEILALRRRQVKNFMALLMLSQGVPMILAGDEVLRSQQGNNNCYCQDNELGWFDWNLVEENRDIFRFVKEMIAFRMRHPCLNRKHFLTGAKLNKRHVPDISWHGLKPGSLPWDNPQGRFLSFTMGGVEDREPDIHVIINMEETALRVSLPDAPVFSWCLAVDTMRQSPDDIVLPEEQKPWPENTVRAGARSILVFENRQAGSHPAMQ